MKTGMNFAGWICIEKAILNYGERKSQLNPAYKPEIRGF